MWWSMSCPRKSNTVSNILIDDPLCRPQFISHIHILTDAFLKWMSQQNLKQQKQVPFENHAIPIQSHGPDWYLYRISISYYMTLIATINITLIASTIRLNRARQVNQWPTTERHSSECPMWQTCYILCFHEIYCYYYHHDHNIRQHTHSPRTGALVLLIDYNWYYYYMIIIAIV